ncbi:hypothetical protein JCM10449v2_001939 [Rhodotorula kratochvilovae]
MARKSAQPSAIPQAQPAPPLAPPSSPPPTSLPSPCEKPDAPQSLRYQPGSPPEASSTPPARPSAVTAPSPTSLNSPGGALLPYHGPSTGLAPLPTELVHQVAEYAIGPPGASEQELEVRTLTLDALDTLSSVWHAAVRPARASAVLIGEEGGPTGMNEAQLKKWIDSKDDFAVRAGVAVKSLTITLNVAVPSCAALLNAAFPAVTSFTVFYGPDAFLQGRSNLRELILVKNELPHLATPSHKLGRLVLNECSVNNLPSWLTDSVVPSLHTVVIHASDPWPWSTMYTYGGARPPASVESLALGAHLYPFYGDILAASSALQYLHLALPVQHVPEVLSSLACDLKHLSPSVVDEAKGRTAWNGRKWQRVSAALLATAALPHLARLETVTVVGKSNGRKTKRWLGLFTSTFEARRDSTGSPQVVTKLSDVVYTPNEWNPKKGIFGVRVAAQDKRKGKKAKGT